MTDEQQNVADGFDKLQQDFSQLEQQAKDYLDGWQRAKADYLNLKRDTEKQWSEMVQFSNASVIAELLPMFRNFKLAWQHVPAEVQEQEWMKGFGLIRKQLEDFLKKFGVEEIKTVGEPFNPSLHEAVDHEDREGVAPDTVIEELQPGYTLHGKVLEPARVKVAK